MRDLSYQYKVPLPNPVENSFFKLEDRITDGRISSKEPFTDHAI